MSASPDRQRALARLEAEQAVVAAREGEVRAWVQRVPVEQLRAAVAGAPNWTLLPSDANFVLAVPAPGSTDSATALDQRLRLRGVAGRLLTALPGIGDAMRITIGPWEMMEPVVAALTEGPAR